MPVAHRTTGGITGKVPFSSILIRESFVIDRWLVRTLAVQPCSLLLSPRKHWLFSPAAYFCPTETLAVQLCSLLLSPRKHWLFSPAALYCCPHGNTGCSALQPYTAVPTETLAVQPCSLLLPHGNTGCSALQPYTAVPTETLAVQLCSLILLSPRKHWLSSSAALYCCPHGNTGCSRL